MTSLEKEILAKVGNSLEGDIKFIFEKQVKAIAGVKRNLDGSEVYFLFNEPLNEKKPTLPRFTICDSETKLATVELEYFKATFKVDVWILNNRLFFIQYSRLPEVLNDCSSYYVRKVDVHV